jgi:peptide/nickel transport system permease protein
VSGRGVSLLRRLCVAAAVCWLVSAVIFGLLYLLPGDPTLILLGDAPPTPGAVAAIRHQYHLDQPLAAQYAIWLDGAVHLQLGTSVRTREPVLHAIGTRAPVTLFLVLYAAAIAIALGVALGMLAAFRAATPLDRAVVGVAVVGNSAPAFVTGLLLLYGLGVLVPLFPVFGVGQGLADEIWHLTLPAVTLALTGLALVIRLTRAAMITTLDQDFIAFARARGLSRRRLLLAYAIRNSLNPIVTAAGLAILRLLAWTVIVEVTFALPGMGALLVDSVNFKDIPVVQALGLLTAVIVIGLNLAVDLTYDVIDPRVGRAQAQ